MPGKAALFYFHSIFSPVCMVKYGIGHAKIQAHREAITASNALCTMASLSSHLGGRQQTETVGQMQLII